MWTRVVFCIITVLPCLVPLPILSQPQSDIAGLVRDSRSCTLGFFCHKLEQDQDPELEQDQEQHQDQDQDKYQNQYQDQDQDQDQEQYQDQNQHQYQLLDDVSALAFPLASLESSIPGMCHTTVPPSRNQISNNQR